MSAFLQITLRSLETGSIYALAALGIIIIYRTSAITNFAQGMLATFNSFVVAYLFKTFGLSIWIATLCGIISAFLSGILIDLVVIRQTKKVPPIAKQIITMGLILIIIGIIPNLFGPDPYGLPQFIAAGNLVIMGAKLSYNGLFNIVVGLLIMVILFYVLQKTKWGLAVRTTASNEVVARMMGVPTKWVTMGAWSLAAILGVLAGVMSASGNPVTVFFLLRVQISAFIACVLGGFQTFHGPVLGAYIVGIVYNWFIYYISSTWGEQLFYASVLIFLLFRPYGLIGKKVVKKV